jgi:hypothetical protein
MSAAAAEPIHSPRTPANTREVTLNILLAPLAKYARMNAQAQGPTQALMLFVATYKNCSLGTGYFTATCGRSPAPLGFVHLAQSLL